MIKIKSIMMNKYINIINNNNDHIINNNIINKI